MDVIAVIRDPNHDLGKKFSFNADGVTVRKDSNVLLSFGLAVQHHVPDINALERLIADAAEDRHAAIINAGFPGIPIGQEFLILSEKELLKHGYTRDDIIKNGPVTITYLGKEYLAVGRFKECITPSSWTLLDRDNDEHTPPHYAVLNYEDWLSEVDKLLPGISKCARLRAHSSSARVSVAGVPIGGGNGHTWVQLANAVDVLRLRSVVKARAIAMDMTWKKPKRSRTTGDVVAYDVVSIIDWSVFTPGRLVFVGKPVLQDV
jgi:hypothetical protein